MHRVTITIEMTYDDDVPEDLGGPGWKFEVTDAGGAPWSLVDPLRDVCQTLTGDRSGGMEREMAKWTAEREAAAEAVARQKRSRDRALEAETERMLDAQAAAVGDPTVLEIRWIPSSRRWEWALATRADGGRVELRRGDIKSPRIKSADRTRLVKAARIACPEYPVTHSVYVFADPGAAEVL